MPRKSNVESMASTDVKMTVPEAARRLGVDGGDVYRLIFRGVLSARPGPDGAVYVNAKSVDEYLASPRKGSKPYS
jgi:excisionase family DNA binding protein